MLVADKQNFKRYYLWVPATDDCIVGADAFSAAANRLVRSSTSPLTIVYPPAKVRPTRPNTADL